MFRPKIATRVTETEETRLVVSFEPTLRALPRDQQRREIERALVTAQAQLEASLAESAPLVRATA